MSAVPQHVFQRVPLQELSNIEPTHHSDSNYRATLAAPFCPAETPVSSSHKRSMHTPPDGHLENPTTSLTQHMSFSTPKQHAAFDGWDARHAHGPVTGHQSLRALLSPAFSSPRHAAVKSAYYDTKYSVNALSPACIDPSSSLLMNSSDDTHEAVSQAPLKPAKKSSKKSKREEREHAFDLLSDEKPPYSYATLIGISILSHPDKQLPLSQIYQWISETFRYYKREDVGWQNSIRHNLSLNKAFTKGEKSKDGKGHFWCIEPGHEEQFRKSRSIRESSYNEVMRQITVAAKKRELEKAVSLRVSIPSSPPALSVVGSTLQEAEGTFGKALDCFSESTTENSYLYFHNGPDRDDTLDLGNLRKRLKTDAGADCDAVAANEMTPVRRASICDNSSPALAAKHLTYTSSFNCDLNLELSPLRSCDTGPLLQPMTPANNVSRKESDEGRYLRLPLLKPTSSAQSTPLPSINSIWLTPLIANMLGTAQSQGQSKSSSLSPFKRTPRDSTVRKVWHSPSYLEDFYYSPLNNTNSASGAGTDVDSSPLTSLGSLKSLIQCNEGRQKRLTRRAIFNSYDDDDMVVRSFENHPQEHRTPAKPSDKCWATRTFHTKNLMDDFKRMESGTPSPPTDIDK